MKPRAGAGRDRAGVTPGGRGRRAGAAAARRAAARRDEGGAGPLAVHVVALVAFACVLVGVTFRLYDTDAWEHLAVGRAIVSLHRIPMTQVWTWPSFGRPNVIPSWGFSVLVWPFWSLGGVDGLQWWRWLTTLGAAALTWGTARRLGARGFAALPVLVIAMLVYRERVQIRPETLAGVLVAATIGILEARRHGGRDLAWGLPLIALVWANSHVSWDLLFLLLAIHLAAGWRAPRAGNAPGSLWPVALACAVACFVNPFGWRALAEPFAFVLSWRHEPLFRSIRELGPIVWSQNLSNGLPAMLLGWPLLAVWRARHGGRDRVEWLMLGVFTALAWSSNRFVPTYALAAAPYLARGVGEWMAAHPLPGSRLPLAARAALTAALCVALGLWDWTHQVGPLGFGFDMSRAPVAACDYMERSGVRGRGLNHFPLGGYLLWRFWPDSTRLPFMDIHPEDSPREVRELYYRALTDPAGWRALDTRFRFDYGLFSRRYADRPGLLDVLDADTSWALVFVDDVAALYLRRTGPMAAVAARDAYTTLGGSRVTIAARLRRAQTDPALAARMRFELERQAIASGSNFYGRAMQRALGGPAP